MYEIHPKNAQINNHKENKLKNTPVSHPWTVIKHTDRLKKVQEKKKHFEKEKESRKKILFNQNHKWETFQNQKNLITKKKRKT